MLNKPIISTILLNWNRLYLLKETVYSYLNTISLPFEIIFVDNGSDDDSPLFIKNICQKYQNCKAIFLPKNIGGGKALNQGIKLSRADLIHISENDLVYQNDWDKKVVLKMRTFPQLGQLSLFSPFPCQVLGETCDVREARQVIKNSQIIYVTNINIGSSCIYRRKLFKMGINWKNIGTGKFIFPDDTAFSREVMKAGFLVAWNDEYLVTNAGHQIDEIRGNFPYYIENYLSKPGGLRRLRKRLNRFGFDLIKTDSTKSGFRIAKE